MGQARNRGTREQRIAQSLERTSQEKEAAKRAAKEWWESLTEEEQEAHLRKKAKDREAVMKVLMMCGMAGMEAER